jgi:hypothetical protein
MCGSDAVNAIAAATAFLLLQPPHRHNKQLINHDKTKGNNYCSRLVYSSLVENTHALIYEEILVKILAHTFDESWV